MGNNTVHFSFNRKDRAIAQSVNSAVKLKGESIQADPQLLFKRFVIVAKGMLEDPVACSFPPAIFETPFHLRAANEASFAETIWHLGGCQFSGTLRNAKYVLDGGSLLQGIPWPRRASFEAICKIYTEYVIKIYLNAVVVFHGFNDGPRAKYNTHIRRYGGYVDPGVRLN